MEDKAVYIGLGVLGVALLAGYADINSDSTNYYGSTFGSVTDAFAAVGAVVGIAVMAGLAIRDFGKK